MRKLILIIILTLHVLSLIGQDTITQNKYNYKNDLSSIFKLGYSYQKSHFITVGYGYGFVINNRTSPMAILAPYFQFEFSPNSNNQIYGQKIGIEFSAVILSAKLSFSRYQQLNNIQYSLTPEIGLTLLSIITLTYGYNFNTSSKKIENISEHVISINVNLSPHFFD